MDDDQLVEITRAARSIAAAITPPRSGVTSHDAARSRVTPSTEPKVNGNRGSHLANTTANREYEHGNRSNMRSSASLSR